MSVTDLISNSRKALKVLHSDGLMALLRIVHYRLAIFLYWKVGNLFQISSSTCGRNIARCKLVIFTGLPYDDTLVGQRAAELTRAGLRIGIQVLYIYISPKPGVKNRIHSVSKIKMPGLIHKDINELTAQEFLKFINNNTSVIFNMPHPLFIEYLEIAKTRGVHTAFEFCDDWRTSFGGDWFNENLLQRFIRGADLVIGTSRVFTNELMVMGRNDAIYLPNAANEYIFDNHQQYKRPADLPEGPFALTIDSSYGEGFGWEYVTEAALKTKDINYCLIGNKPPKLPINLPQNVYFLGEKKIEELPAYLSGAQFCLLPIKPSSSTDAESPITAYEYIFMAKPVVSTDMVEVKGFPLLFTASNKSEFASLCQNMKDINGKAQIDNHNIDAFIAHNSWFSRLQRIIELQGQQNVSVIILIHNNRQIIGRCLESLYENCSSYLAEVVVVDNASDDGGGEYVLEKFPEARLICNPVNGCSSGRNLGANHSTGKYLAFFDSDQWFTSGFCFEEALNILRCQADIGAVGWAGGWFTPNSEDMVGPVVDYFPHRARNAETYIKGFRTDVPYLSTAGLFVPRTIFKAAGGFDTAYDPTCFEDTDLSFAIRKLGFGIAYRDLTGIRHEAHQTTKAHEKSPEYREVFSRNAKYIANKWNDYRQYFSEKKDWMF
jgi:glycosyltransferase involved in cell wall biosynthesis